MRRGSRPGQLCLHGSTISRAYVPSSVKLMRKRGSVAAKMTVPVKTAVGSTCSTPSKVSRLLRLQMMVRLPQWLSEPVFSGGPVLESRSNVFFLVHLPTECMLFSWHFLLSFVFQKLSLFSPLTLSVSGARDLCGYPMHHSWVHVSSGPALWSYAESGAPRGLDDFRCQPTTAGGLRSHPSHWPGQHWAAVSFHTEVAHKPESVPLCRDHLGRSDFWNLIFI